MQKIEDEYINKICPTCINKEAELCSIVTYRSQKRNIICCKCSFYNNVGKEIQIEET